MEFGRATQRKAWAARIRWRTRRSAIGLAIAAASLAAGLGAPGQTLGAKIAFPLNGTPAVNPSITGTPAMSARAAEIQALKETAGLSERNAEENLAVQHRASKVDLVGQLEERLGSSYAGIWFNNDTGEFVVPIAALGTTPAERAGKAAAVAQ